MGAARAATRASAGRRRWVCLAGGPPLAPAARRSVVVEDRAGAAALGEQRVAAEPGQVQVERLVGLPLAVALHLDGDGLRGLAGREGDRPGFGDVVAVAR